MKLNTNRRDTTSTEKREEETPVQAPLAQETCTGKMSPPKIWLQKPVGLNFVNLNNQWSLSPGTLRSAGLALREPLDDRKLESLLLKKQHNN